jgi:hypothetical protein
MVQNSTFMLYFRIQNTRQDAEYYSTHSFGNEREHFLYYERQQGLKFCLLLL